MGDPSFSIQISTDLVNKLVNNNDEPFKKRAKKPKPKPSQETHTPPKHQRKVQEKHIFDDSKILQRPPTTGWPNPIHPPHFTQTPSPKNPELDSIRSVVRDSEKVLERLQKKEDHMSEEVTQKAKDLHAKEYKLPEKKPMACLDIYDSLSKCYKEHQDDPLKCAAFVNCYEDCARKIRQEVTSSLN